MGRKKRGTPQSMNRDLKQACFELQRAMLLASNEMKAEEWLSGANEDYTNGFWTGWMFCEDSRNISEICKEIFGKD